MPKKPSKKDKKDPEKSKREKTIHRVIVVVISILVLWGGYNFFYNKSSSYNIDNQFNKYRVRCPKCGRPMSRRNLENGLNYCSSCLTEEFVDSRRGER